MTKILIKIIKFYQKWITPFRKPSCVFVPSCSQYAKEAISKYGAIKGGWLAVKRIVRCNPWQKNFLDPIP
ncbi:MAG: membrane protein insertion efficiency factor YidD [Candidatus Pacebacteria bacterium]|nr:membrane protein insertion efficiency factor YidD [Candidatus Paceibacterota bacterium]MCF7862407.1 membrane protein insertion efficiency factor YidD [Candidatus Paceibacterota bacterium]